jgi:hypothetical protein
MWSEYNNGYPPQEVQKDLKHSTSHRAGSQRAGSPPASPVDTYREQEGIVLQPETRPITQEQLVNEVKGLLLIDILSMLSNLAYSFPRHLRWVGDGGEKMCGNRPAASGDHQQAHQ